jgi:uncharacterized membrane-anchored protein
MNKATGASGARMFLKVVLMLCMCAAASVQGGETDRQTEAQAAFSDADKAKTRGPAEIALVDQGSLKLPQGFVYIPAKEGARLLTAMGNRPGDGLLGLIFPEGKDDWLIVLQLQKSGFIKDEEAKDWKVDELLANIKAGTEEANKDRRARGIPELEVIGWVEPPAYDASTHRLVWSLSSKQRGEPDSAERGVNYNTYALGRDGYISLNLVTGMNLIQTYKPTAHVLLAALDYKEGKRYADFNASTDRVAEYGLAALIGGVAAKKLGLFAVIAAFFLKFTKLIGVAVIGLIAGLRQFMRRKNASAVNPPTAN